MVETSGGMVSKPYNRWNAAFVMLSSIWARRWDLIYIAIIAAGAYGILLLILSGYPLEG